MGGYIALEIWRQAPERVRGLALVDTQARPDSPEATAKRRDAVALAEAGKFRQVLLNAFPLEVNRRSAIRLAAIDYAWFQGHHGLTVIQGGRGHG